MVYNTQNCWFFGTFPSPGILKNRKHDVSETASVSVLRWGGKTPTELGPLERANLDWDSKGPLRWGGKTPTQISSFYGAQLSLVFLTHLRTETDPVSETSCFLFSRMPDDGKVQKPSNSVFLHSSFPGYFHAPHLTLYSYSCSDELEGRDGTGFRSRYCLRHNNVSHTLVRIFLCSGLFIRKIAEFLRKLFICWNNFGIINTDGTGNHCPGCKAGHACCFSLDICLLFLFFF
jgi:hypothetical protein